MRRSTLLAALFFLHLEGVAHADDPAARKAAASLVEVFVALCVHNVPDLDRIEHTASMMDLKDVTGQEGAHLAPLGSATTFKVWRVIGAADAPFTLSISRGHDKGKDVAVCAVEDPYAPPDRIENALKMVLKLERPFRKETVGDQRYTYWDMTIDERKVIVSAVDATPVSAAGVNLAATVIGHH